MFSISDPPPRILSRLNMLAGESEIGWIAPSKMVARPPLLVRLLSVKIKRTELPSSHPAWSASDQRISLTPEGLKLEALEGWKVASRRFTM